MRIRLRPNRRIILRRCAIILMIATALLETSNNKFADIIRYASIVTTSRKSRAMDKGHNISTHSTSENRHYYCRDARRMNVPDQTHNTHI